MLYVLVRAAEGNAVSINRRRGNDWDYRNPLPVLEFGSYKEAAAYIMEHASRGDKVKGTGSFGQLEKMAMQSLQYKINSMADKMPITGLGNGSPPGYCQKWGGSGNGYRPNNGRH